MHWTVQALSPSKLLSTFPSSFFLQPIHFFWFLVFSISSLLPSLIQSLLMEPADGKMPKCGEKIQNCCYSGFFMQMCLFLCPYPATILSENVWLPKKTRKDGLLLLSSIDCAIVSFLYPCMFFQLNFLPANRIRDCALPYSYSFLLCWHPNLPSIGRLFLFLCNKLKKTV